MYSIDSYKSIYPDEHNIMKHVVQQPICATVDASTWSKYGKWEDDKVYGCDNKDHILNHGVLLVGYGTEKGTPYWFVRNSYGTEFGDKGYTKILQGKNTFGIEEFLVFPILDPY
ncbi:hypothetical protein P8452_43588 [Trifolium repens]|nr:hypothetical protein P8452_43588 [Trifolium repens]